MTWLDRWWRRVCPPHPAAAVPSAEWWRRPLLRASAWAAPSARFPDPQEGEWHRKFTGDQAGLDVAVSLQTLLFPSLVARLVSAQPAPHPAHGWPNGFTVCTFAGGAPSCPQRCCRHRRRRHGCGPCLLIVAGTHPHPHAAVPLLPLLRSCGTRRAAKTPEAGCRQWMRCGWQASWPGRRCCSGCRCGGPRRTCACARRSSCSPACTAPSPVSAGCHTAVQAHCSSGQRWKGTPATPRTLDCLVQPPAMRAVAAARACPKPRFGPAPARLAHCCMAPHPTCLQLCAGLACSAGRPWVLAGRAEQSAGKRSWACCCGGCGSLALLLLL